MKGTGMEQQRIRARLNRAMIAAKALEITDRDGLVGLSMRRLGKELGVEGMALYRHYPEKEAILDQVVDLVLGDLKYPATALGWQEDLRLLARALRDRLLSHPNAMPLVAARWLHTELRHTALSKALQEMNAAGLDPPTAHFLIHAVMSFLLGHCWVDVGAFVGDIPEAGGLTRVSIPPAEPSPGQPDLDLRSLEFERGVDFLLRGAQQVM